MFVGQQKNLKLLEIWNEYKSIPRFLIICGDKGSGRLTLAKKIAVMLKATAVIMDNSINNVRETIQSAYTVSQPTVYIFDEADTMSVPAKNSMLKVTEEPPNNAYFIMILSNMHNTLDTICSRATSIIMEAYSREDLANLTKNKLILNYCETPGQVKEWNEKPEEFEDFIAFCQKVADNIGKVSGVNSLKINNSLSLKADADGYDPILFINVVDRLIQEKLMAMQVKSKTVIEFARNSARAKYTLTFPKLHKQAIMDKWVLRLRELMREVERESNKRTNAGHQE